MKTQQNGQMSIEQARAMIKGMHAQLEKLEIILTESTLNAKEKWEFPKDNYTVLATWLLYDPMAHELFPVNKRKSWVELADKLTEYTGWVVDWHSLRRNFTRKNLKKAK